MFLHVDFGFAILNLNLGFASLLLVFGFEGSVEVVVCAMADYGNARE